MDVQQRIERVVNDFMQSLAELSTRLATQIMQQHTQAVNKLVNRVSNAKPKREPYVGHLKYAEPMNVGSMWKRKDRSTTRMLNGVGSDHVVMSRPDGKHKSKLKMSDFKRRWVRA